MSTQRARPARLTCDLIQRTDDGVVACVGGRGPFDDVVSAMLAQLLAQRGIASRTIPHTFVSRELIAQLDLSDVRVVVVSCLELAGTPAHLRYLIRRLRHRAPRAVLIAGLWPQGETVLTDPQIQTALGGDQYVTSLREAIDATVVGLCDRPGPLDGPLRPSPARLASPSAHYVRIVNRHFCAVAKCRTRGPTPKSSLIGGACVSTGKGQ